MKARLFDLLFSPDTFFSAMATETVNLTPPFLIVSVGCILSLLGTIVPLCIGFLSSMGTDRFLLWTYFPVPAYAWLMIRCDILPPLLGWIIVSGLFCLLLRIFAIKRPYTALLRDTGYGMLPWVISCAVTIPLVPILISRPEYWQDNLFLNPATVAAILFYGFLVWCCVLWVFAIRHTAGITTRRAAGIVAAVVILCFVPLYLAAYFPIWF